MGVLFLLYMALRILAWENTVLLEGVDGVFYLEQIDTFASLDTGKIAALPPDVTPFYPFFGALFRLPFWSTEFAARLCSLVFSALLFFSLVRIGGRIAAPLSVGIGLLFVGFNPTLIPHSFSVFTESSYIATCYLGLWLVLAWSDDPKPLRGALLGALFALAFLNRTEGLIYLLVVPFMQAMHYLFVRPRSYDLPRLARWTAVYGLLFLLLSAPQVWRVSSKMGCFAVNGRQAWTMILKQPDGRSYEEKVYGLDFSPAMVNLDYVQSHPEALASLSSKTSPRSFLAIIADNLEELYRRRLGSALGPVEFALFAVGLLALCRRGKRYPALMIALFIAVSLIPPLIHNVVPRHLAIAFPGMLLLAGVGATSAVRSIFGLASLARRPGILTAAAVFLFAAAALYLSPVRHIYIERREYNVDYNPERIGRIASIVREAAEKEGVGDPSIVLRKMYLAYYAGMRHLAMPWTDFSGLVKYCEENDATYLFLTHRVLEEHPLLEAFRRAAPPERFELLHRERDDFGGLLEVYRFRR